MTSLKVKFLNTDELADIEAHDEETQGATCV